jgi:tryptophanyl-tRNA synthetase
MMATVDEARVSGSGQPSARRRVFSGIQPTGGLHLGNYLGAIRQWVQGQDERENFFCIVDLHAITVPQDPADLVHQTRSLAAMLLAAGIDPQRSTLFVQGHVSAHSEASWILNCVTPVGWLERMTQYKDKASKQESVLTGLLDYPVLMAADILLYDAHEVPVGEDQKQHVELTRDIAERFNRLYGETFVIPEPVIPETGARVMGLDDPTVKMSKSFANVRGHAVRMQDDPKEVERSIMRAVTDSGNEIRFSDDPAKAGVNNLLGIYKAITGKSVAETERDFADARGYGDLKKRVAEVVISELAPIRERHERLMSDPDELDRLLAIGAEQARAYAVPKLEEMKGRVGLTLPGPELGLRSQENGEDDPR